MPYLEIADAQVAASAAPDGEEIVLGGERGGQRIDGFDLGDSPAEYTRKAVAGKRVFLTTTNGTRALNHARLARRVLVGSFVNLSAIADSIRDEAQINLLSPAPEEKKRVKICSPRTLVDAICFSDVSARTMNDSAVAAPRVAADVRSGSRGGANRGATFGDRAARHARWTQSAFDRVGGRPLGIHKSMRSTSCLSWIFRHGESARRSGRMMW